MSLRCKIFEACKLQVCTLTRYQWCIEATRPSTIAGWLWAPSTSRESALETHRGKPSRTTRATCMTITGILNGKILCLSTAATPLSRMCTTSQPTTTSSTSTSKRRPAAPVSHTTHFMTQTVNVLIGSVRRSSDSERVLCIRHWQLHHNQLVFRGLLSRAPHVPLWIWLRECLHVCVCWRGSWRHSRGQFSYQDSHQHHS